MHSLLYLVLAYCSVSVPSVSTARNTDGKEIVGAYIGDSSSERQIISNLRKWIFGRGEEKEQSKTKVKYLPIYVPVPVYSGTKVSSPGNEPYGAHHQNNKKEKDESIPVATKPGLLHTHTQPYNLPFGSHMYQVVNRRRLPMYYIPYGEHLIKPAKPDYSSSYHNPYSPYYAGYEYSYDNSYSPPSYAAPESNDHDSEVLENPDLVSEPESEPDKDDEDEEELYTRKRKRYRKNRYQN